MKRRKYYCVLILIVGIIAVSCRKETEFSMIAEQEKELMEFNSSEEFALILSKALYDNESLRDFLQKEALKQFDKDYDVFYPLVRERVVAGESTFRELLSRYDDKGLLPSIERSLPLLTILVPDWSWVESFSVKNWDTADPDISVIYTDSKKRKAICFDGQIIYVLEDDQVPGFPAVIVKQNERVRVSARTKSGEMLEYEFIDDEFNASIYPETRVEHQYYDRYFDTEDYSNFISYSEMQSRSSVSATAYSTFIDNPYASHRDNIYYGMTNSIQQGKLNPRITEYIAKIRFGSLDSQFFFDGDDFYGCPDSYTRYVEIDDAVLINKFYYEGNLELYFHILIGNTSGTVSEIKKYKSVSFDDVFQLAKVHVDFRHRTWVSDRKWVYTVDKKCFVPKWYDANIQLPQWDISSQSTIMNINVSEYDDEQEITTTKSIVNSFTTNFSSESGLSIGNPEASGSIKVGYGVSSKNETTQTVTVKTKNQSDDLGTARLYYTDPIILSPTTLNGVGGYRVKEINTGFVYMLILPRYE